MIDRKSIRRPFGGHKRVSNNFAPENKTDIHCHVTPKSDTSAASTGSLRLFGIPREPNLRNASTKQDKWTKVRSINNWKHKRFVLRNKKEKSLEIHQTWACHGSTDSWGKGEERVFI